MPPSELSPLGRRGVDQDLVYFCENACLSSFSGCIDEDSTMTEQDIVGYILHSNPKLHKKLNGLRLPSSHLSSDENQYSRGGQAAQNQRIRQTERAISSFSDPQTGKRAEMTRNQAAINIRLLSNESNTGSQAFEFVLDRYRFTLHQHSDLETVYCCSYPTCPNPLNVIPFGERYGSVSDESWNQGQMLHTEEPRTVYYCFDCLQTVLKHEFKVEMGHQLLPQFVDGTREKEKMLKSAEKIHPPLKRKELKWMYFPEEPPLSPGKESNSEKGSRLRRQKQYEIERILEEVEQKDLRNREYMRTVEDTDSGSLGLLITHRRDLSPFRDRYKKQGLEFQEIHGQSGSAETPKTTQKATLDNVDASEDEVALRCFCKEPADDDGMVQCSSTSCMFGAIHLRCSGVEGRVGITAEAFVCKYCRGDDSAETACPGDIVDIGDSSSLGSCDTFDCKVTRRETTNKVDKKVTSELIEDDQAWEAGSKSNFVKASAFTAVNTLTSGT